MPGGEYVGGADLRPWQAEAARWVADLCATGYGPDGGAKLVADDAAWTWLDSPAAALRELGPVGPFLSPYRDLALRVGAEVGDQATTAVALAARLVLAGLRLAEEGVRVPATVGALPSAARQARAVLASLAVPDAGGRCLEGVAPPDHVREVLGGLAAMPHPLDLGAIDVVVEPGGPAWGEGVRFEAPPGPGGRSVRRGRILVCRDGPRKPPAGSRVRSWDAVAALGAAEAARTRAVADAIVAAGVAAVACARSLGDLGDALSVRGVLVWTDAPMPALRRLEAATGATMVPIPAVEPEALGVGEIVPRDRRRGGWWARGAGGAWTLVVPGEGLTEASARNGAERLLRAAGAWWDERVGVPGGGAWQAEVARSLRGGADATPGRTPLVWRAVADAFAGLDDALAKNAGGRGGREGRAQDVNEVMDVLPAVRTAVAGAFETARTVLRTDAMWRRRPSRSVDLRGGGQPDTLRGMAGDVPPLM